MDVIHHPTMGLLSYSHPAEACSPIDKPPSKSYTGKWIVLIRRCNCTFEDKVRNAEKAGYAAAIIHNVNSSDLEESLEIISDTEFIMGGNIEPMSANGPTNITIPSVFVGQDTGIIIRERFQWNDGYYIVINDNIPFNINTHLLMPFVIVIGICFLIMMSFMIVKCIKDRMQARRHRLPSSALKKIPTTRYKSKDPYETCAICLEDYLEGDKLRILPCSHAFHCKCIDPWLTCSRRECPMCKRKVFAHDERIPSDEEENDDRGDHEAPRNRRAAPLASDESDDEAAPLIQTRGRQTQGRHDNPRGGGTFQTQRENPFRRAAMRLRGSLSPAVAPPPPPANVHEDTSSTSSLTSSGSFNSLPSDSNQQSEAVQDPIPSTTVVIPADPNPSPARMSVNSSPADIQDVTTAPHNAQTSEEGRHGDLVV
ncbi:hypothetical protein J437_LFUL007993 [Ladona fulva]|uniref:RING-type domain-containing protein n=1 Tax=Ladona fulva TaxID=123851 RepID=A0A8K0K4P9_LADFU|nr:hypothetical protein J437_LFUL007993 [Ladona fulva]